MLRTLVLVMLAALAVACSEQTPITQITDLSNPTITLEAWTMWTTSDPETSSGGVSVGLSLPAESTCLQPSTLVLVNDQPADMYSQGGECINNPEFYSAVTPQGEVTLVFKDSSAVRVAIPVFGYIPPSSFGVTSWTRCDFATCSD
jgi:hypothetical protein